MNPRIILWLVLAMCCWPATALADSSEAWVGAWDAHRPDGVMRLELRGQGDQITGSYTPGDGVVSGQVNEDGVARGQWRDAAGQGEFTLQLSGDATTFFGHLDDGQWWTGGRVDPQAIGLRFQVDLSSPQAALRSFLIAGNNVRIEKLSYVQPALACLAPAAASADATVSRRRSLAMLLFQVIDRTTVRLAEAPRPGSADRAVWTLRQAGTDVTIDLAFTREDEAWRLVVPSEDALRTALKALHRGGDERAVNPLAHLSLTSARATMRAFLEQYKHWDAGGRDHVQATLDMDAVPEHLRYAELPLIASYLKQTLDRVGYVVYQEIPDDPHRELPYVHFRHPVGDIVITPTQQDGVTVWRFSGETLAHIRALYERLEDAPLASSLIPEQSLAPYFQLNSWVHQNLPGLTRLAFGLEVWQWLAVGAALMLAGGSAFVVDRVIWLLSAWWMVRRQRAQPADDETQPQSQSAAPDELTGGDHRQPRLFTPLSITLGVALGYEVMKRIGLPLSLFPVMQGIAVTVLWLGVTWTLYNVVGQIQAFFAKQAEKTTSYYDELLVSVIGSCMRFGIIVVGLLAVASHLGVSVAGMIAGVGLGGLAIGFAAKDTLSSFFGSLVLLADRPFKKGELVKAAGHLGFIVKMGLRSTQMRTLQDSVVTVPNSVMVNEVIDNWGRRCVRRIVATVSLTYSTPADKLDAFVSELREVLLKHERISEADLVVGVYELAASSIDIQMIYYVSTLAFAEERQVRHEIVLEVTRLAKRLEVEFAFPTRTVYFASGDPVEPPSLAGATS